MWLAVSLIGLFIVGLLIPEQKDPRCPICKDSGSVEVLMGTDTDWVDCPCCRHESNI